MRISSSSKSVIGLVVYRTGAASSLFYKEYENTLGILATYNEEVLTPIYRQLQIRRWNFLDTEKFISELKLSPLLAATSLDVDSASDLCKSTLSGILDKMIPFKTIRIHERPSDPWFDRECGTSKCLKRSLERIYMRTKSENDFAAWLGQKKLYKRLCRHKRRDYWNNKLSDPKNKTANIWSHINSVSGRGKRSSVDRIQPVKFQSFLLKKVESARNLIRAR